MLRIVLGHSRNLVVFPGLVSKGCLVFLTLTYIAKAFFHWCIRASSRKDRIG